MKDLHIWQLKDLRYGPDAGSLCVSGLAHFPPHSFAVDKNTTLKVISFETVVSSTILLLRRRCRIDDTVTSLTCLHLHRDFSCISLCFPFCPDHRDGVHMLPVSKSKGRAILGEAAAAAAEEVKCVGEGGNLITSFHTQIAHWFLFFLPFSLEEKMLISFW